MRAGNSSPSRGLSSMSLSSPSRGGSKLPVCHMCGRQFGSASLEIHQRTCRERYERERGRPPPEAPAGGADSFETFKDNLEPCPFCPVECCADGRKTRKRRRKAVSRTKHRHGRWWQTLGYTGPVSASSLSVPRLSVRLLKQLFAQSYCQRCSEVFRDHIIREKPNSAGCSRARACDECAKVLTHFTGDLPDHKGLWDRIDAKGYAKVRRSKPKSKPTRGFV